MLANVARIGAVVVVVMAALAGRVAVAENRIALVIGNAAYGNKLELANPVNDAEDVAAALRRLDFTVILKTNLDKTGMDAAFGEFAIAVDGSDVALFYYAGHALELNGKNYLMPLGAKLESEASVPYQLSRVDDILDELRRAKGVRVAILDSCRDNPFAEEVKARSARTRSGTMSRGLARIDNAEGMLVVFAAQAGSTAADGRSRNSQFTAALLRNIETPGLEIGQIFRRVAKDVYEATEKAQLPELSISLLGEFYFKARGEPPPAADDPAEREWQGIKDTESLAVLRDFVGRYPQSIDANLAKSRIDDLTWKAVKDTDSLALLVDFVKNNPESAHLNKAKARIEEIAWNNVKDARTPGPLDEFLAAYPNSVFANTARLRKEEIAWNMVKGSAAIQDLQDFINKYPTSIYANYARIRIDELTPRPQQEEVLVLYNGVDFYGGDIAQRSSANLTDCAQLCADENRCRYFTYVSRGNSCILKDSYDFATAFDGATAGQYAIAERPDDAPSITLALEIGVGQDYYGNDFSSFRARNFDDCLQTCSRNSSCNACSFAPKIARKDNCWLKSSAGLPRSSPELRQKNVHAGKRVSTIITPSRVVSSR